MKKKNKSLIAASVLAIGLTAFMTVAGAAEKTRDVEGVNYVSLSQMAGKYNLTYSSSGGVATLYGDAIDLNVPIAGNKFTVNGESYYAQLAPSYKDGHVWITAKDWAEIFDMSLTFHKGVSEMQPTEKLPLKNTGLLRGERYDVGSDWGEKVPEGVRKHGHITNITTPVTNQTMYFDEHIGTETAEELQAPK